MWKNIGIGILIILIIAAISFFFGAFDVFYTKTIGVQKENANREVFKQTQSYVEGMRSELIKLHHEYLTEKDSIAKISIENTVRWKFASFDEDKYLLDYKELRSWLKEIKSK